MGPRRVKSVNFQFIYSFRKSVNGYVALLDRYFNVHIKYIIVRGLRLGTTTRDLEGMAA